MAGAVFVASGCGGALQFPHSPFFGQWAGWHGTTSKATDFVGLPDQADEIRMAAVVGIRFRLAS